MESRPSGGRGIFGHAGTLCASVCATDYPQRQNLAAELRDFDNADEIAAGIKARRGMQKRDNLKEKYSP